MYTNTVKVPRVRTSAYSVRSFRSAAAKLWNSLPQSFRETSVSRLILALGAEGSADARCVQTVNFCSLFCLFNVLRTSFCHKVTAHMMF